MSELRDFWCPNCKKKGLHFYDKNGNGKWGEDEIADIDYLWCLHCGLKITTGKRKAQSEENMSEVVRK